MRTLPQTSVTLSDSLYFSVPCICHKNNPDLLRGIIAARFNSCIPVIIHAIIIYSLSGFEKLTTNLHSILLFSELPMMNVVGMLHIC